MGIVPQHHVLHPTAPTSGDCHDTNSDPSSDSCADPIADASSDNLGRADANANSRPHLSAVDIAGADRPDGGGGDHVYPTPDRDRDGRY